ncbi:receptor-binding cancer antigen expressed on SiSo cells-like [Macrobrachium nipponense]|uniref:receptor-binding cancer antigen expressed on SiSo cells-like n=1 Tax=Macrobrachium nipponense TaxID=159736 RepID=UPI0030C87410
MFVLVAVKKIKSLLLLLLNAIRRCFCCFRKRRISDSHLPVAITSESGTLSSVSQNNPDEYAGWDTWDVPSSVVTDGGGRVTSSNISPLQDHINQYRLSQQKKLLEQPEEQEEEPNYFEDLTPKIEKKPQVVILERPEEEQVLSNRLSFSLADTLLQSSELEEWVEDCSGWEGEAEEEADLDLALQEKRQQEREQRRLEQQRRKAEKDAQRTNKLAASKISTKLS